MRQTSRRFALLLLCATAPLFALKIDLPVAGHGVLRFGLPDGWKEESRNVPEGLPPTVTCERSGPVRGELLLTVVWSPDGDPRFGSEENARGAVRLARDRMLASAVEADLPLVAIKGAQGAGSYLAATDKNYKAGAGQYLVATTGALGANGLLLVFTVLSAGKNDLAVKEALTAVRQASLARR
jgi:hypothetical protein